MSNGASESASSRRVYTSFVCSFLPAAVMA